MTRTGLLIAVGAGVLGGPDASSLLPFALVVGAVLAIPAWWKRKPKNQLQLPARILSQPAHYHYCDGCDHQWRHNRSDCIAHWACQCPACAVPYERPTGSAGLTPI
jgi:hypothetical protein